MYESWRAKRFDRCLTDIDEGAHIYQPHGIFGHAYIVYDESKVCALRMTYSPLLPLVGTLTYALFFGIGLHLVFLLRQTHDVGGWPKTLATAMAFFTGWFIWQLRGRPLRFITRLLAPQHEQLCLTLTVDERSFLSRYCQKPDWKKLHRLASWLFLPAALACTWGVTTGVPVAWLLMLILSMSAVITLLVAYALQPSLLHVKHSEGVRSTEATTALPHP